MSPFPQIQCSTIASLEQAIAHYGQALTVFYPGVGKARINQADYLGEKNKYPGGGPALAAQTVEHNFGLRLDKMCGSETKTGG